MKKSPDISAPAAKTLEVLEFFSNNSEEYNLKEISERTKIAHATLLRILNTLTAYGYLVKNAEKQYSSTFSLKKAGAIPPELENNISQSLEKLVCKTGQSAEIITVKGENLYWHNKKEAEDNQIKIAAYPGFKRSIYELDAPVRLFLKLTGEKQAGKIYRKNKFYDVEYRKCTWQNAVKIFENEKTSEVIYDRHGNSNGIRRYAALITDKNGSFMFILSIAEAATMRNNKTEHVKHIISMLNAERLRLQKIINKS